MAYKPIEYFRHSVSYYSRGEVVSRPITPIERLVRRAGYKPADFIKVLRILKSNYNKIMENPAHYITVDGMRRIAVMVKKPVQVVYEAIAKTKKPSLMTEDELRLMAIRDDNFTEDVSWENSYPVESENYNAVGRKVGD